MLGDAGSRGQEASLCILKQHRTDVIPNICTVDRQMLQPVYTLIKLHLFKFS